MKRGSKRIILGLALLIGGGTVGVMTFSRLYRGDALDPLHAATGEFQVSVDQPGRYYIWDHTLTHHEGETIRQQDDFPEGVSFAFLNSGGQPLDFQPDTGESWSIGNHVKASVGYVDITKPGNITAVVKGGNGERLVSFSPANMAGELWQKLGGFAWAAGGILLGGPALLWGLIGSIRSHRPEPKAP